ncbi:MAG TPA: hypothetical protein VNM69_07215 [Bacillus sp. (in: firmicutes)]|uniref:hypothetical protein n=1 Tax=Bacillus litorisediminis TaxID=2922713 RepID=UPI001FAC49C1|nr:hypothetical protein [Bacillus litorisediminis]HWO75676.1 hypothetical protein [Bacillus sp. (in: firmicutes)]
MRIIVNQDFDKFRGIQSKHRPAYLGGEQNQEMHNSNEFSMNKKGETESVGTIEPNKD